ncbi:flavodoxin [Cryobacterium sp. TMT2-18-3]|uniref:flavodoxin domain-containing protein n=1 Tax=unclassified Cryobacterium TaxID=2649013 RepID=UPI00106D0AD3|nr:MULTISPECIES: flavodoxin domain-containing protein [unclassified Cryobacterium]TFC26795.1 flavodoxin [Cryobacterium sp. TMT2-18-2]TFC36274.1 flavodoxin [Cryobacterium sp. TMT2-42-4]TFC61449.1 flavodoxin [Cryobacterium sp. TMT2-15-1]TFC68791.1 flavodoxin [Cryobacterium sp. TMT2-18-3]
MTTLVGFSSKYGATEGIAERIARKLREAGQDAVARPVASVDQVDGYDAFVIGSSAYMGSWRKDATEFVRRHQELITAHPVWLFSSGPLGTAGKDAQGRDLLKESEPKQFEEFGQSLQPRGMRVFFGALDPAVLGRRDKLVRRIPSGRELLPEGDFRNWVAIDEWAAEIARELSV